VPAGHRAAPAPPSAPAPPLPSIWPKRRLSVGWLGPWSPVKPSSRSHGRPNPAPQFHTGTPTRALVEVAGGGLLFLLPYSPDCNPIERD